MGQLRLIGSILLLMVFTVAIISYATNFGIDNQSGTRIDDLDSSLTDLNSDIYADVQSSTLEVNDSSAGFFESSLPQSSDNLDTTSVTGGQFKTIFTSPVNSVKTILSAIDKNLFGNEEGSSNQFSIVLTALISFLVIAGILYIWKTWKGGNPN